MLLGKLGLKVHSKVFIYTNLDLLLAIKLHIHVVARYNSLVYFCIKPALSVAGNYENH